MKQLTILRVIAFSTLSLLAVQSAVACTSAIISGKITPDGRPLLWKNRDTDNLLNCVRHMKGPTYNFVAVTAYSDQPTSAWIGTNEAGFAIMNTLSYNLTEEGEGSSKRNGALMKQALGICATVADFRHYLDTLQRPMNVRSNYGVIDAQGNGSYFEVNSTRYKEYDVNNPDVAPHGYLVRTNFSVSGTLNEGAGYIRYQEAYNQLFTATAAQAITPGWLFSNLSRSFHNPLMGIDLKSGLFNKPHTNGWFVEQDFIARRSTSCAVAIQGVKPGEDVAFTTMWTVIGYPPVTPAVPVWVRGADKQLPAVLTLAKGTKSCPLCDAGGVFRDRIYSYKQGSNTENYLHWEMLFNAHNTGLLQQTEQLETELFQTLYRRIDEWRNNTTPSPDNIHNLYNDCDSFITKQFDALYHIKLLP
jgi:hypothetical protein